MIHVSGCRLLDTRPGHNNNSDGFAGAAGSSIRDSFLSTSDDGIKIYHDMVIENVTIEHHRNGAPIQLGWGGETGHATARITHLVVRGVDPENRYNMAPITWEAGASGSRELFIQGFSVDLQGRIYHEEKNVWDSVGLFEVKPEGATLQVEMLSADLDGLPLGWIRSRGTVSINGTIRHDNPVD